MFSLPLQTERLLLRTFLQKDLEFFHSYRSDPVLARYQGWTPMSEEKCREFIREQTHSLENFGQDGHWTQIAIVRKDTKELIGDIGLCSLSTNKGLVTIGFTLAQKHQGRGFAIEAIQHLLCHLFSQTCYHSVKAITDQRNISSIRLLKRLGFQHTKTQHTVFKDEPCEEETYYLIHTP